MLASTEIREASQDLLAPLLEGQISGPEGFGLRIAQTKPPLLRRVMIFWASTLALAGEGAEMPLTLEVAASPPEHRTAVQNAANLVALAVSDEVRGTPLAERAEMTARAEAMPVPEMWVAVVPLARQVLELYNVVGGPQALALFTEEQLHYATPEQVRVVDRGALILGAVSQERLTHAQGWLQDLNARDLADLVRLWAGVVASVAVTEGVTDMTSDSSDPLVAAIADLAVADARALDHLTDQSPADLATTAWKLALTLGGQV